MPFVRTLPKQPIFNAALVAFYVCTAANASGETNWTDAPKSGTTTDQSGSSAVQTVAVATPADPQRVVGNDACVKCHASEIRVWQTTPHALTFDQLHRTPEAKQIASKLRLRSIKHSGRCVNCHYTQQSTSSQANAHTTQVIAGVSCESCHGAAKDWLELHHDYGGQHITRLTESPAHHTQRITRSIQAGMRNPANVYLVAQSCLRCHTTADEQLVNVGGHSAGSLDFEFVSWSQGTIRHNFVRSDGEQNDVSPIERVRVMFVAGMIAELESSLRATAVATEKATFGMTVAQRAARTSKRLQSVAAKVNEPLIVDILNIVKGIQLKLNNEAQLTRAADEIAKIGYQFAATNDGSNLSALDGFIPKARK